MKNIRLRKNLFIMLMYSTVSLYTLTGCSLKNGISSSKLIVTNVDNNKEDIIDNKEKIDIKITLSSTYDYYNAYKVVDSIKEFVEAGNIGNIYLDIGLGEFPVGDLRKEYIEYVEAILEKLSSNGIDFTLIGEEWQLKIFNDYKTMSICSEKDEVKEKVETFGMAYYKEKIYYKKGISIDVSNDASDFIEDEEYVVQNGDNLIAIADRYGITDYKSLGKYNEIKDYSLIRPGDVIIIPSLYGDSTEEQKDKKNSEEPPKEEKKSKKEDKEKKETKEEESGYVEVDEDLYYKGIDVSQFQGKINWEITKDKVDFAIIRMADTCVKDKKGNIVLDKYYRRNMDKCRKYDIPVGVYLFSRALTKKDMQNEINFVLENLKDENGDYYDITRPIYIDIEEECEAALYKSEESRKKQVELIEMFCSAMEEAGYATGVYINSKYVSKIKEVQDVYSIWISGGDLGGYLYHTNQSIDDMYYAYSGEDEYFTSTYGINVIQTTSRGDGKSIGVESQYVDFDYGSRDFFDALDRKFGVAKSKTHK